MKPNGQTTIETWYETEYPNDSLAANMNKNVTFQDLYNCLDKCGDMYALVGVEDSLVREHLFEALAALMGVDYDYIYEQWLYRADGYRQDIRLYTDMTGLRFTSQDTPRLVEYTAFCTLCGMKKSSRTMAEQYSGGTEAEQFAYHVATGNAYHFFSKEEVLGILALNGSTPEGFWGREKAAKMGF